MPTLDWLNRANAFTTAARVPYRLLEQVSIHSPTIRAEPDSARTALHDNLLIQGDNLEALKALLPFYRGQVKCIFIDPPYNTQSAFEHYDDNLEHAQWLSMMLPRLQKVIDGEQGGISKAVGWGVAADGGAWTGGGFRFMRLGETVFDESGRINLAVRFATLAAFVWQQETGTAFEPMAAKPATPYLGTHYVDAPVLRAVDEGAGPMSFAKVPQFACYLLFNGILGDKRPASGNVLTQAVLDALLALHATTAEPAALLVVYGEACRLGAERLKQANVTFKHIPYDVRAR